MQFCSSANSFQLSVFCHELRATSCELFFISFQFSVVSLQKFNFLHEQFSNAFDSIWQNSKTAIQQLSSSATQQFSNSATQLFSQMLQIQPIPSALQFSRFSEGAHIDQFLQVPRRCSGRSLGDRLIIIGTQSPFETFHTFFKYPY